MSKYPSFLLTLKHTSLPWKCSTTRRKLERSTMTSNRGRWAVVIHLRTRHKTIYVISMPLADTAAISNVQRHSCVVSIAADFHLDGLAVMLGRQKVFFVVLRSDKRVELDSRYHLHGLKFLAEPLTRDGDMNVE